MLYSLRASLTDEQAQDFQIRQKEIQDFCRRVFKKRDFTLLTPANAERFRQNLAAVAAMPRVPQVCALPFHIPHSLNKKHAKGAKRPAKPSRAQAALIMHMRGEIFLAQASLMQPWERIGHLLNGLRSPKLRLTKEQRQISTASLREAICGNTVLDGGYTLQIYSENDQLHDVLKLPTETISQMATALVPTRSYTNAQRAHALWSCLKNRPLTEAGLTAAQKNLRGCADAAVETDHFGFFSNERLYALLSDMARLQHHTPQTMQTSLAVFTDILPRIKLTPMQTDNLVFDVLSGGLSNHKDAAHILQRLMAGRVDRKFAVGKAVLAYLHDVHCPIAYVAHAPATASKLKKEALKLANADTQRMFASLMDQAFDLYVDGLKDKAASKNFTNMSGAWDVLSELEALTYRSKGSPFDAHLPSNPLFSKHVPWKKIRPLASGKLAQTLRIDAEHFTSMQSTLRGKLGGRYNRAAAGCTPRILAQRLVKKLREKMPQNNPIK